MSSLLPQNATPLETALAESIARISDVPTPSRDVWNADACPSNLLPWLAWAFSVDFWDAAWSDDQKRAAIKSAVAVQRYKGTLGSVTNALDALGYGVTIQEWFKMSPMGAPYTFDVLMDSSQVGVDQAALAKILSYIDATKNLRSHLRTVRPSVTTRGGPNVAGFLTMGNEITIPYDGSFPMYSDGTPAFDLVLDAMNNGEPSTTAAMDGIDTTTRVTMPANSWKSQ